jgi:hypothetical protein
MSSAHYASVSVGRDQVTIVIGQAEIMVLALEQVPSPPRDLIEFASRSPLKRGGKWSGCFNEF